MKTYFRNFIQFLGGTTLLSIEVFKELWTWPFPTKLTIEQIYQVGLKSLPIAFITAASTGMVMALQFGLGLEKFGGKLYVPKIVSLSIIREMGPVFTCLMLAARVGAGITSEIGSMTVTQQIDALRALGTSPIKKVVIPRVVACLFSIPLLVAIANAIGVAGGMLVGSSDLGLDPQFYMQKIFETITLTDYFSGFAKAPFFAIVISLVACYYGLNVEEGTRGVGSATTKSVVTSSIFILVGDYFLTKAFWVVEQWL
ncbi:MAG TPA: ABC transporter permease [Bdellovibrionales bacterium]|nr:ABC transporter permease [Pseudobdellovibrionaceae bacterium]HAG92405.1 ABC transporter permease [Bdellovibrionales bacterium]|tara:strand:+ start:58 stop:825 length:768 start_codon:yes stop_codon:yes gene_type:complete